jgi:V/A-type H+-transporting ATPase subunit A
MARGNEVEQMMKVVGEEGTSLEDYEIYLKGDFLDAVYFQQNSFDPIDGDCTPERQKYLFQIMLKILRAQLGFMDKAEARTWFARLRQKFLDFNGAVWQSDQFKSLEKEMQATVAERVI